MPLSTLQLAANVSVSLQKTVTGWPSITQGPDVIQWDLSDTDLSVFTQAYAAIHTINASGSTTIDLQSFTNLATESVTLTKALAMVVTVSGATGILKIQPGASNGLAAWFFGSTDGVILAHGDKLAIARDPTLTPVTVDGTHKTIKLENTGAATITVTIVIIGG